MKLALLTLALVACATPDDVADTDTDTDPCEPIAAVVLELCGPTRADAPQDCFENPGWSAFLHVWETSCSDGADWPGPPTS